MCNISFQDECWNISCPLGQIPAFDKCIQFWSRITAERILVHIRVRLYDEYRNQEVEDIDSSSLAQLVNLDNCMIPVIDEKTGTNWKYFSMCYTLETPVEPHCSLSYALTLLGEKFSGFLVSNDSAGGQYKRYRVEIITKSVFDSIANDCFPCLIHTCFKENRLNTYPLFYCSAVTLPRHMYLEIFQIAVDQGFHGISSSNDTIENDKNVYHWPDGNITSVCLDHYRNILEYSYISGANGQLDSFRWKPLTCVVFYYLKTMIFY